MTMQFKDSTGGPPIDVSHKRPLPIDNSNSYEAELARGHIEGATIYRSLFAKTSIGATFEDIWEADDVIYLLAEQTISFVSDSVEDAVGLTGSYEIEILGVDENYKFITEVLTLTGTTPAVTTKKFFRIDSVHTKNAGSNMSNVGNITGSTAVPATTQAYLKAGDTDMAHSTWTAPATGDVLITEIVVSTPDDGDITFRLEILGKRDTTRLEILKLQFPVEAGFFRILESPILIPKEFDFRLQVQRVGGGNNKEIDGEITIVAFED